MGIQLRQFNKTSLETTLRGVQHYTELIVNLIVKLQNQLSSYRGFKHVTNRGVYLFRTDFHESQVPLSPIVFLCLLCNITAQKPELDMNDCYN